MDKNQENSSQKNIRVAIVIGATMLLAFVTFSEIFLFVTLGGL